MKTLLRLLRLTQSHWRAMLVAGGLGFLTIGSGIALLSTSAYLISAAALLPSVADLQVAIIGVRFFGISRGVFRYLERLASHSVSLRLLADLRAWFYAALEPLAPAHLQARHSGDLLARAVSDVDSLQDFFVRVVAPPLAALFVALTYGIFLWSFSPVLTVAVWAGLTFVGLGVPTLAHTLSGEANQALVAARARLSQLAVDTLQGLPDLLANNATGDYLERANTAAQHVAEAEGRLAWVAGLHSTLSSLGVNGGAWLVLLLAIPLVSRGEIAGVALAVVVLGTLASFEAVLPFGQTAQVLRAQLAAAERLFELVDAPPGVAEPHACAHRPASNQLSLREVHFAYQDEAPVLAGLSLELAPGARVAILGPSGAGKTTIFNLLLRFWEYQQGKIELGGVDIRQLPTEDVRRAFAVVPQQVHIFNASLEENLRLARPDGTREDLETAARQASILEFIQAQPAGWATWAGEQGLRLSGGERQRLGVARALLRPAPILLLDEFTTHLDQATAGSLLAETLAATKGRSLLLITHSRAGLEAMDAVYELQQGRLQLME